METGKEESPRTEIPVVKLSGIEVSADGRHVFLDIDSATEPMRLMLASPLAHVVMAGLQHADALARERYLGQRQTAGTAERLPIHEPKNHRAFLDGLRDAPILVFDSGLATEAAYVIPRAAALALAAEIKRLAESPATSPKPN